MFHLDQKNTDLLNAKSGTTITRKDPSYLVWHPNMALDILLNEFYKNGPSALKLIVYHFNSPTNAIPFSSQIITQNKVFGVLVQPGITLSCTQVRFLELPVLSKTQDILVVEVVDIDVELIKY
jgi:hypothetical protein